MNIVLAQNHEHRIEGYTSLMATYQYQISHVDNLDELMRSLNESTVDVLILDLLFGGLDTRTVLPIIQKRHPKLRIILQVNTEDIAIAKSVVHLNVHGLVYHSEPPSTMLHALESIAEGKSFVSTEMKDILGLEK